MAHTRRALTYREIADDLQRRMKTREFPPGCRLPHYHRLAEVYGVSASTTQRAMMLLRGRDLVLDVPGRGVFVKGHGPANGQSAPDAGAL